MKKIFFVTVLALLSVVFAAPAQETTVHRVLSWKSPVETVLSETEKITSLYFDGASYNEDGLPVSFERIALTSGNSASARIENAVYEPLKETNLFLSKTSVGSEATVKTEAGIKSKKWFACVTVFPFRKSSAGIIERLVSYDLKVTPSGSANAQRLPGTSQVMRTYTSNSVLAAGDWYKIGVTTSGISKISSQFLKKMGLNLSGIDPRNIKIYSNGGGQLGYANALARYDDLQENAIYIEGENDGKFDGDDYIFFYGDHQTTWTYDSVAKKFNHSVNLYSDTTYYFLTVDASSNGKRIPIRASSSITPTHTVTDFDDYDYHEADLVNMLKSGREWYGETFDNQRSLQNFMFSMPNISATDTVKVTCNLIGRSCSTTIKWQLFANNVSLASGTTAKTGCAVTSDFATILTMQGKTLTGNSSVNIALNFSSTDGSAQGWLNYIEVNARRALSFAGVGKQMLFRDTRSAGAGNVGQFIISSTPANLKIWNVTDPINVVEQASDNTGGQSSFVTSVNTLQEFLAFNGNDFNGPVFAGRIANQNLHAMKEAEMLIVTNPKFLKQANDLADFHRKNEGLRVNVATTNEVFNEFASGSQDASAIRDFIKMFYDRAIIGPDTTSPKFLLLFGSASYDNKYRINGNTNNVTSYESANSLNLTSSYISDDFFGLLDDNEGVWDPNTSFELLDLSVGRLPLRSQAEAEAVVKKIISYSSPDDPSSAPPLACGVPVTNATGTFGDWRNIVTFVGDDQDQNTHYNQSETLSGMVKSRYPAYNIEKIYLDAYKQESTPGGQRYPDARDAIVKRVQRGTLLMTYVGHGGEVGWAHERVLENEDINGWTNFKQLPAFLTATCEFSRPDNPAQVSAGELVILNPNGGGICLFTTTRLAFSGSNFSLAQAFFNHFFVPVNGVMPTSGEVFEQTKVDYNDRYTRNFMLLGDPAVRISYPKYNVKTTTINSHPVVSASDTLKALSKMTITGELRDNSGNKMTSFNGLVYPTVYDKWTTYHTLGNDLGWTGDGGQSYPAPFDLQKNILYKGKSQVKNGDFSFSFIVPKDISYTYGFGKLSYYAENGQLDAQGYDTSIVVGGLNSLAAADNAGPEVKLYMNDDKFVFGGVTDQNPILFATVRDENGINTIGNGIGHDVTSIMDNQNAKMVVLNDYYQSDMDSYQSGSVRYPFNSLSEGRHSLSFKVWDVYNNSSEARTEFIVASSAKMALDHVLNYPNPFTTHTTFTFEHNRAYCDLDTQVQIFTVSGKLVKTIDKLIYTEGYHSMDIEWDGRDDYGDKIGRGVYVYKLKVKACDGTSAEKFEKLVVLR